MTATDDLDNSYLWRVFPLKLMLLNKVEPPTLLLVVGLNAMIQQLDQHIAKEPTSSSIRYLTCTRCSR